MSDIYYNYLRTESCTHIYPSIFFMFYQILAALQRMHITFVVICTLYFSDFCASSGYSLTKRKTLSSPAEQLEH